MLALVPVVAAGFGPAWHARGPEQTHPARCCYCERDIAVTPDLAGLNVGCVYCGIDRGEVPEIDVPFCAE